MTIAAKRGRTALLHCRQQPITSPIEHWVSPPVQLRSEDARNHPQSVGRIVVGVDGSDAAINAAKWAVAEATSRDIPLRLIHAVLQRRQTNPPVMRVWISSTAKRRCAPPPPRSMPWASKSRLKPILCMDRLKSVLIDESRRAAMICIGPVGIGQVARTVIGSTADSVARNAHCPVAVIRRNRGSHLPDRSLSSSTMHPATTLCLNAASGKRDFARRRF